MPSSAATTSAAARLSPVSITTRTPAACSARIASCEVGLIGSETASSPIALPSRVAKTTVRPWARSASARTDSSPSGIDNSAIRRSLPSAAAPPPTVPVTPLPMSERKPVAAAQSIPRCEAAARMAEASGCSLPFSRAVASCRSSSSPTPTDGASSVSFGLPSVSVPVLSTTRVSTLASAWSASALRISTPARAPRPIPTMIDIGVARPSAQGQAMISTATALTRACARRGSGPSSDQTRNVTAAAATTAGTNTPATLSASPWIGARLRCASDTIPTMRASSVSAPTRSARITKEPVPFTVPPVTRLDAAFSTGSGSPVSIDSSTLPDPSTTTPSVGTFSPGRTRSRSPGLTSTRATSRSPAPGITSRAVVGAKPSRARIALPVRARARSSSTWPRSTRAVITAADSK